LSLTFFFTNSSLNSTGDLATSPTCFFHTPNSRSITVSKSFGLSGMVPCHFHTGSPSFW